MKRILSLLLVLSILLINQLAFASSVDVGGKSQDLTLEIKDGRAFISTDSLTQFGFKTTVKGQQIEVSNAAVQFTFYRDTNKVNVNQASLTLDAKSYAKNGVSYVPLKFFFETINYKVGWSSKTSQITLYPLGEERFPIIISDGDNRYKFSQPAERVVSLAPSVTEILFAIGAGDVIIGRTIYCDYPKAAASVHSVGSLYEPDLEGILDLEPDVVIAATHMNEDVLKTLKSAKIEILTQKSPEKVNEIYTFISKLGLLVDHNYEARALISSLKLKEERVHDLVASIPVSERKTVYYVVGTGKKEFTAGSGTFIDEVLKMAGGVNVAEDVEGWSYSLEKLIEHDPSYILGESYSYDTMISNKNYKSLSALKNQHFVEIDSNVFSRPGPRVIDIGLKIIIHELYPTYEHSLNY